MQTALDALKSLENEIAEVKYAAGLAADLVSHFPSHKRLPDGYVSVTIRLDQLEELDFAVYEVQRRARALNDGYHALEIAEEAGKRPSAPETLDARDKLNEGMALAKSAWLALSSPIFGDGKDDNEAVSETVYAALFKLQEAKEALEG